MDKAVREISKDINRMDSTNLGDMFSSLMFMLLCSVVYHNDAYHDNYFLSRRISVRISC